MKIRQIAGELRASIKYAKEELHNYYGIKNFDTKPDVFLTKSQKERYGFAVRKMSEDLELAQEQISQILPKSSSRAIDFFTNLSSRIKAEAFSKGTDIPVYKNRLDIINNLSKSIRKPSKSHYAILNSVNYDMESKIKLLSAANTKHRASLIAKLIELKNADGKSLNLETDKILEIANLEQASMLDKNFEQYRALIAYRGKNENFVDELTKQIATPNASDLSALDTALKLNELKRLYPVVDNISKEADLVYAPHGLKLISQSEQYLDLDLTNPTKINKEFQDFLKNLIMTTTEKNYKIRQLFVKSFGGQISAQKIPNTVADAFLTKIDIDEDFYKLFEKLSKKQALNSNISLAELMYYSDVVGAKNLLNNIDRFINMINENPLSKNEPNDLAKRLCKYVNNKHYMTYREELAMKNKEMSFSNTILGSIRSNLLKKTRMAKDKISKKHENDTQLKPLINETYETYIAKITGTEINPNPKNTGVAPLDTEIKPKHTETPVSDEPEIKNPTAEDAPKGVITDEPPKSENPEIQTPQTPEPTNVNTPKPQETENPNRISPEQNGEKVNKTNLNNNKKIIPWIIGTLAGITVGSMIADKTKKK